MNSEFLQRVLDDNPALKTLPQTMFEVLRVTRNEQSSTYELAEVILKDPALTATVLRIVNSPFYGAGREVSSVTQAVVAIGMRQVTALALSSSVYRMTDTWESSLDRVRFWRHSLEVAIASRMVAATAGYRHIEEAFVAGLLHDLGLLILERSFGPIFLGHFVLQRSQPLFQLFFRHFLIAVFFLCLHFFTPYFCEILITS